MEKIKVTSKEISNRVIIYHINKEHNIDKLVFRRNIEGWYIDVNEWCGLNRKLILFIESVLRGLNSK